jgi:hypothetical protein
VLSLAIRESAAASLSCGGSTAASSGAWTGDSSDDAEWNEASDTSDDAETGCAARPEGADTRVGEADREAGETMLLDKTGNEGRVDCKENHGCARICAMLSRLDGSTCRMFLIRSRASVNARQPTWKQGGSNALPSDNHSGSSNTPLMTFARMT